MGQKVHPIGFRLGITHDWQARWFAEGREYSDLLHEDVAIRRHIKETLFEAGIDAIEIERFANRVRLTVHAAKPGIVIGRGGTGVERLRQELEEMTGRQIHINVLEVRQPSLSAQLVAEGIAVQLQRRIAFRRAIKQAATRAMRAGAKGVRIMVSGRLGGSEMSRSEWTAEGSVPLHTLRANIDYGFAEAYTTYGQLGVKVWINLGETIRGMEAEEDGRRQRRRGGRPAGAEGQTAATEAGAEPAVTPAASTPEAAPAEAQVFKADADEGGE